MKSENVSFSKDDFVSDDFTISKSNPLFEEIVRKAVNESGLQKPDTVKITAYLEW